MRITLTAFGALCVALSSASPMMGGTTQQRATVTIQYVNEFGKPWNSCHVSEFSFSQNETHLDFAARFDGMVGRDIPFNTAYYDVRLKCPGALVEGPFYVSVRHSHEFVLISAWNHAGDYHTGLGPRLTVHVPMGSPEKGVQTWVKISGVYLDSHEVDAVDPDSQEAQFYNVVPGRYLVLLLTGRKVACVEEIDFLDPGARLELVPSGKGCQATGSSSVKVIR